MSNERLIEKLDRMGKEAGIPAMTPEIRRFALLVREDMCSQWPNDDFQERLADAIEDMPFGDTAASFAQFVRDFK